MTLTITNAYTTEPFTHSKTGESLTLLKVLDKLSKADYISLNALVRGANGYYSKFAKGFLLPCDVVVTGDATNVEGAQQQPKATKKYKPDDALLQEYKNIILENEGEKWLAYYLKEYPYLLKMHDGIIHFGKPRIETSFCFGYSDSAYDTKDYDDAQGMANYAKNETSYFIEENLKDIEKKIADMKKYIGNNYKEQNYYILKNHNGVYSLEFVDIYNRFYNEEMLAAHIALSDADKQAIIDMYEIIKVEFTKRLNTYLKKYGLTKVRSWSYWQDA